MPNVTPAEALEHAVLSAPVASGVPVVVAVSGGPDSVALLHATARVAARRDWKVVAVHVEHGLRPEDAEGDISFVRDLAAATGVELDVEQVDTRAWAAMHHMSVETAARELRYGALEAVAARVGAEAILVGHTRNDQAETLLMHLLRGAGLVGLRGMQVRRGRIVRPFLALSRTDIEDAVREFGVEYRLDPTNEDRAFERNRIRHDVIPVLTAYRHDAVGALARTAALLAPDADFLLSEAQKALDLLILDREPGRVHASAALWRSLHPALQRHTLRLAARSLIATLDIEERHVSAIMAALSDAGPEKHEVMLPGNLRFTSTGRDFELSLAPPPGEVPPPVPVPIAIPGQTRLSSGTVVASLHDAAAYPELPYALAVAGPLHLFADAGAAGLLQARRRSPGDRVRPLGLNGSKKLQDVFVDGHVPAVDRDSLPVVENNRHIVWVPGLVVDERAAVHPETRQLLHLVYVPNSANLRDRMRSSRDQE